jgi:hypothetical protein
MPVIAKNNFKQRGEIKMNKIAYVALSLLSIFMSGCASNSIPQEKQKNYALLVPGESMGTDTRADIVQIDQENFHRTLLGSNRDAVPGRHSIRMETCFANKVNAFDPICKQRDFVIDAQAGLAYVFLNAHQVKVYDRFDRNKFLYDLKETPYSVFLTPEAAKLVQNQEQAEYAAKVARDREADAKAQAIVMEGRKRNLPLVRKIGTRICREQGTVMSVGYVEAVTDEKVQIRISNAHFIGNLNAHPEGFSPNIIWDSPLNWDLCE